MRVSEGSGKLPGLATLATMTLVGSEPTGISALSSSSTSRHIITIRGSRGNRDSRGSSTTSRTMKVTFMGSARTREQDRIHMSNSSPQGVSRILVATRVGSNITARRLIGTAEEISIHSTTLVMLMSDKGLSKSSFTGTFQGRPGLGRVTETPSTDSLTR